MHDSTLRVYCEVTQMTKTIDALYLVDSSINELYRDAYRDTDCIHIDPDVKGWDDEIMAEELSVMAAYGLAEFYYSSRDESFDLIGWRTCLEAIESVNDDEDLVYAFVETFGVQAITSDSVANAFLGQTTDFTGWCFDKFVDAHQIPDEVLFALDRERIRGDYEQDFAECNCYIFEKAF